MTSINKKKLFPGENKLISQLVSHRRVCLYARVQWKRTTWLKL